MANAESCDSPMTLEQLNTSVIYLQGQIDTIYNGPHNFTTMNALVAEYGLGHTELLIKEFNLALQTA